MDAEELIENARDQRKRGRFEEAVISARAATSQDPDNADGWWQLALNNYSLGKLDAALTAVRETNYHAPYFAQGWSLRGKWELEKGNPDEAENSFKIALEWDEEDYDSLHNLAKIYGKLDINKSTKIAEEIQILTKLDQVEPLNSWNLNRLGRLHFFNKHGFEAIKYWSRNCPRGVDTSSMFNLGLAYNMDNISQDVDAVDCWRMVLRMEESHENKFLSERAVKKIQLVEPRLLKLAELVRASRNTPCLPEDQWYSLYLNPYQLLNCPGDIDFSELDNKTIQVLKKTLLQEIELEDGKLEWLPGMIVNRSKAIELSNQLSNSDIAFFHWQVYECKPLLEFLSKGDINLFLLDKDWSPLDLIEFVLESDEFKKWLSEPFSTQYDRILTIAISARNAPLIEALLDGRRWILPSYADRCFENAIRESDSLLTGLRKLKKRAETSTIFIKDVGKVLDQDKITSILNFLPPHFRELQNEAVTLVRSVAIDAHNIHGDTELSLAILDISKRFSFKSIELTERLKEDYGTILEIIQEQKKHESHLTLAKGRKFIITKEGIWDSEELCPAAEIRSLRWGISIENYSCNYLFKARRSTGREYVFSWSSSHDDKKQIELFEGVMNATWQYLIPSLIEYLLYELNLGNTLRIGSVMMTKHGLTFDSKGFLFTKRIQVSWARANITIHNGSVIIADLSTNSKSIPLTIREVENASLLPILQMSLVEN